MPKGKRELDAYTLRWVADDCERDANLCLDMVALGMDGEVEGARARTIRGIVKRLRARATRIEKRRGRA